PARAVQTAGAIATITGDHVHGAHRVGNADAHIIQKPATTAAESAIATAAGTDFVSTAYCGSSGYLLQTSADATNSRCAIATPSGKDLPAFNVLEGELHVRDRTARPTRCRAVGIAAATTIDQHAAIDQVPLHRDASNAAAECSGG